MFEPVIIEKGDLICINVVTETVWVERVCDIPADRPWTVPQPPPTSEKDVAKRHFSAKTLLKGVKNSETWMISYTLAYTIAWVAGFRVGDETGCCLNVKDTYVFKVM